MRSGHVSCGRAKLAKLAKLAITAFCAGFLVMGICVRSVHAQASVVFAGGGDAELLARIRGQTRDLPITLIPATSPALPRPSAAQLQAIAGEFAAEFVVHVVQEPSGARVVYVLDARAGELRVRAAPAPQRKRRFARSAAAETVALIVRGELSDALAARASQAVTASSTENTPSPALSPSAQSGRAAPTSAAQQESKQNQTARAGADAKSAAPPPQPADNRAEPEAPEPEEPQETEESGDAGAWLVPRQLSLELAGRLSTAVDDRYFIGAALSLRCSFENFSIGVTGASSLANRRQLRGLTLTLHEHAIGAEAFVHVPLPAGLRAGFGATGRWLFYQRNAASGDPDWKPEPGDTSSSFAVGPQLELRWQLAQHLGLGVRIGLDVLLRPVSWRYRLDTNPRVPIELERQNRTEPWLTVGAFGSL